MAEGITWQWETYAEYLDALDRTPKGINYSGYIGHSALRTYVMGERAFDGIATDDDLSAMRREVERHCAPAPSDSARRVRRTTRRPTIVPSRAGSRRGPRCSHSWAS